MSENKAAFCFRLERMVDGGYVVMQDRRSQPDRDEYGYMYGPVFASSTIEECFKYMKKKMEPADGK